MRKGKFSLKKCFLVTLGFAVIVIFGFSLREKDFWSSSHESSNSRPFDRHLESHVVLIATTENKDFPSAVALQPSNRPSADQILKIIPLDIQNYDYDNEIHSDLNQKRHHDEPSIFDMGMNNRKPWYFMGGKRYPQATKINRKTKHRNARLFPAEDQWHDRITNQLMFVPPNYETILLTGKMKTILAYNGLGSWNVKQEGREMFSKCPVNTCKLTANREVASTADLILYKDHYLPSGVVRPARQIYMLYFLECPYHTQHVKFPDAFNWTATYRSDSDIVAPYEKWEYYDPRIKQMEQDRNYAQNKTKKVAWFVSNCGARNGRLNFAHELQKYIQVDIYGSCGSYKCSRSTADKCFEILDLDYKFYLAFENSNCKDYITEKFFVNSLNRNILPIVMGARPEDYENSAPYRSYIHVDEFASAKELADYLNILDKNDELYNSYFKWKGTGEFINTYFWCRVCSMIHDEQSLDRPKWYTDVNEWWRGPGICTNRSWRNFEARKDVIKDESEDNSPM